MLVTCEFHEAGGKLHCDTMCEHCGEVAEENVDYVKVILEHVYAERSVICQDCENSKCKMCGKFPTKNHVYGEWVNGVCWKCRDEYYDKLLRSVRALLSVPE